MLRVVGISEMAVSTDVHEVIVTYALGSCLGISMFDPQANVGGLIHCMLPLSKNDPDKARVKPCMYTDTGVVTLLQTMMDKGADKKRLIVKVAGGASPLDKCGRFKIGERNLTVLRKVLWKNDLLLRGEDVGGTVPRTMTLYMSAGQTTIKVNGTENKL